MPENATQPEGSASETAPAATPEGSAPAITPESTAPSAGDPAGSDALGDAGKKALDAMKAQRNAERDRRKALEAELAELKAPKPAEGAQPDVEQIKAQAAREAQGKANARVLRSEIKAAAAGKFADPADALAFLDVSKFEVDENGDVDADEIKDAIDDLLTRKPHLGAKSAPRFQGTGDGGASGRESGPKQLTRAELQGKSPEWIAKAKADGRLNKLLGIK